jgi:hypothetical protein
MHFRNAGIENLINHFLIWKKLEELKKGRMVFSTKEE